MERSPLAKMFDASVRCTVCGAKGVGSCACWDKCGCGRMKRNSEAKCSQCLGGLPRVIASSGRPARSLSKKGARR